MCLQNVGHSVSLEELAVLKVHFVRGVVSTVLACPLGASSLFWNILHRWHGWAGPLCVLCFQHTFLWNQILYPELALQNLAGLCCVRLLVTGAFDKVSESKCIPGSLSTTGNCSNSKIVVVLIVVSAVVVISKMSLCTSEMNFLYFPNYRSISKNNFFHLYLLHGYVR